MKYVAVISVCFEVGELTDPSDESWHMIDYHNEYIHEWRFTKCGDFDIVVGLFDDAKQALVYAKRLYVSVLYMAMYSGCTLRESGCEYYGDSVLYNKDPFKKDQIDDEPFYINTLKDYGVQYGFSVYEVQNSIEECKERAFGLRDGLLSVTTPQSQILSFLNIEVLRKNLFSFSKNSQEVLYTLLNASTFHEVGIEMTIYCGILEHWHRQKKNQRKN